MDSSVLFVVGIVFMAYVFDFLNGFHDAANAIATIVTTKVLSRRQAIFFAAFFNFISFFFFNLMIAKTMGGGLVAAEHMNAQVIFSALFAAIFWNLLTWYYGLPSSSSHALIGGISGAAILQNGVSVLQWEGMIKVMLGLCIAPFLGLIAGLLLTLLFRRFITPRQEKTQRRLFTHLQLISSAFLSLTHGANDAQKTMGIIAVLLFSTTWQQGDFVIPLWIIVSSQLMISLGTLAGGWRIIRTMGTQITELTPLNGCAAETSAALMISLATEGGVPVSTTQVVTGSIAGVGLVKGFKNIHKTMLSYIFLSWGLTLPITGILAALCAWILQHMMA